MDALGAFLLWVVGKDKDVGSDESEFPLHLPLLLLLLSGREDETKKDDEERKGV